MSPRSIRRAAERKAEKLARKATSSPSHSPAALAPAPAALTPAASAAEAQQPNPRRLAANRANAALSTGPTSPAGKAKISLNAVKTGLTGRTVLLPSEDAALYEQHISHHFEDLRPVGYQETALVQSIADTSWRLRRIPELEMAIYAVGHSQQLAESAAAGADDPDTRLFQLQTFLRYEKQLRNLQLQESRLRRHREKDLAELRSLQQERQAAEEAQEKAAQPSPASPMPTPPLPSPQIGFVFSNAVQASEPDKLLTPEAAADYAAAA